MSSLSAITAHILQALESGKIGLQTLISIVLGENTTHPDAYVAYVAVVTYLLEHKPDNYEEAGHILKDFMKSHHAIVMDA